MKIYACILSKIERFLEKNTTNSTLVYICQKNKKISSVQPQETGDFIWKKRDLVYFWLEIVE